MYFVLACLEVIRVGFFTESQCTFNIVILLFFVVPRSFPNINYFVRKEATCPWISRWANTVVSGDQEPLRSGVKDQADEAVDL